MYIYIYEQIETQLNRCDNQYMDEYTYGSTRCVIMSLGGCRVVPQNDETPLKQIKQISKTQSKTIHKY